MTAGRAAWADAAKGLLIVLVVFWHVVLKTCLRIDWRIDIPIPGAWGLLADLTYPIRMPLFFLISGCFAAAAVNRPWRTVVRGRVLGLLYVYLLWTLIHTATMWMFPDFPTLVPRSVGAFVEAVTISPPNTWYLYALALYFVVARLLRRTPAWLAFGAATALSVAVGAGLVDVVSNRGSLLANLLFFLIGVRCSTCIRAVAEHPRPRIAAAAVAGYLVAFAVMRLTGSAALPGVWPAVGLVGVGMGMTVAPLLLRLGIIARGLVWLGTRTLPVYVVHMPVLVLVDAVVVGTVSAAGPTAQLIAAIVLPVAITAVVLAASVMLGALFRHDRLSWLLELPSPRR